MSTKKKATKKAGGRTTPKKETEEGLTLDVSKLTFREAIIFEEVTGVHIENFETADISAAVQALAFTYIALRREDPEITLAEVEGMDMHETIQGLDERMRAPDLDPTPASD